MRELLFRGKSIDNGEWIYSTSIHRFMRDDCKILTYLDIGKIYYEKWESVDSNTVGQWTGLVDNKGNKIFEGDIVKRIVENENGLVVWDDKRCGFYILPLTKLGRAMYDKYYKMNANKLEIVGNKYENSHLLEDKV